MIIIVIWAIYLSSKVKPVSMTTKLHDKSWLKCPKIHYIATLEQCYIQAVIEFHNVLHGYKM